MVWNSLAPPACFRFINLLPYVEETSGSPSPDVQSGPHERIYLVGKNGTPDILIARTSRGSGEDGITMGQDFGGLLNLPCERKRVPY